MTTQFYYTFKYCYDGSLIKSGGNAGVSIVGEVDHEKTRVGDVVEIVQFNRQGSFPAPAEIVGKLSFDWDMSKPIGQRKSNELKQGYGY